MTRPMVLVGLVDGKDGHPDWCAGGHHCTARHGAGEHASASEVWRTDVGRVVATRYRSAETGRGHLELRIVVRLPADESTAQRLTRHLITVTYWLISRVLESAPR